MMRERLSTTLHRACAAGVRRLPGRLAYPAAETTAAWAVPLLGVRTARMRDAYARVRPELTSHELDLLVQEGMRAYARYWCDTFRAPTWSNAHVQTLVRTEHIERLHEARAASGGAAVLWLGHVGNWDLAGRWSAANVAPVTTVAERLRPESLFQEAVAVRAEQGITVLPLTGAGPVFPVLLRALRGSGLVALVADRDLTGTGVRVDLCGHTARVAAGPAALARATGAPLVPVLLRRDEQDTRRGERRHVIEIGEPVTVQRGSDAHQDVLVATQAVVDQLGEHLRRHTAEWHMLQRVFEATP